MAARPPEAFRGFPCAPDIASGSWMREPPSKDQRLDSLQALRAVAATLVVFFHAAAIWREKVGADVFFGAWDRGWAGVDLFFVLSGFIMVWVTQGEKSLGLKPALQFGWKRLTRIYPIWWVFCALMGAYFFVTYGQAAPPPGGDPWLRFWQSMALWPQPSLPVLTIGWTLTFEIGFYALFAGLLLIPSRYRLGLLLVWGGIILAVWLSGNAPAPWPDNWVGILLNPICLEFIAGAGVSYLVIWNRIPLIIARSGLILGLVAFSYAVMAGGEVSQTVGLLADYSRILQFGLPAALIVLGLAMEERARDLSLPQIFVDLGDASYSLYLLHLPLLLALIRIVGWSVDIPVTSVSFTLFVLIGTALCLAASLWVHRLLERPLIRLSRFPLVKGSARRRS